MKKGCFIKVIVLFTILIAVLVYLFKYKYDDFVLSPVKSFIATNITEDLKSRFEFVENNEAKDSLLNFVNDYILSIKNFEDLKKNRLNDLINSTENIFSDSLITIEEFETFKSLFMEKFINEK